MVSTLSEHPTQTAGHLLEQLGTAVVLLDPRLSVSYANAAAETLLAGSGRRLPGAPFESLFRYASLNLHVLQHLIPDQQTLSDSDVVLVLHDGKSMTVEFTALPIVHQGNDALLLEMRQVDLIRRLNQEQMQQHQLAAAQQLVRGLAHEIKNPLGGIRGAAQLLHAELHSEALEEYTRMIMAQSDRLRGLVDRLLGPNRPGPRDWVNVHEVIARATDVMAVDMPAGVSIVKDYDPSLPELYASADQLEQVILNILKNALEAVGSEGEVILRTRVSHGEAIYGKQYRQAALISIIDNGPGVADALKDTLFYPLVSGREGGTGLGLSIAQSLVHQHAGKIEVNSRPGQTQFTLCLPYILPESTPENAPEIVPGAAPDQSREAL
ncbi:MAG: nitrogen regulation protein NR(II) [Idiomarina sp.]|nr:nitrogen regulation protein NR(II) [Idiomarina sp.]